MAVSFAGLPETEMDAWDEKKVLTHVNMLLGNQKNFDQSVVFANKFLSNFQSSSEAWDVTATMLSRLFSGGVNGAALTTPEEFSQAFGVVVSDVNTVRYFLVQTLAKQALAGHRYSRMRAEMGAEAIRETMELLVKLLLMSKMAPEFVRRQLALAVAATVVFVAAYSSSPVMLGVNSRHEPPSENDDEWPSSDEVTAEGISNGPSMMLANLIEVLLRENDAAALAEILTEIPDALFNKRAGIAPAERAAAIRELGRSTVSILNFAFCPEMAAVRKSRNFAFVASWLKLHNTLLDGVPDEQAFGPSLKSHRPVTCDLLSHLSSTPVLAMAASALQQGADGEMETVVKCLVEAIKLAEEFTDEQAEVFSLILETAVAVAEKAASTYDDELTKLFLSLFDEFAQRSLPALMNHKTRLEDRRKAMYLCEVAFRSVAVSWDHPEALEIRLLAIGGFYALTGKFLPPVSPENIDHEVVDLFTRLLDEIRKGCVIPADIDGDPENADLETPTKYRQTTARVVIECFLISPMEMVLANIMSTIEGIVGNLQNETVSFADAWSELDSWIFLMATIAGRVHDVEMLKVLKATAAWIPPINHEKFAISGLVLRWSFASLLRAVAPVVTDKNDWADYLFSVCEWLVEIGDSKDQDSIKRWKDQHSNIVGDSRSQLPPKEVFRSDFAEYAMIEALLTLVRESALTEVVTEDETKKVLTRFSELLLSEKFTCAHRCILGEATAIVIAFLQKPMDAMVTEDLMQVLLSRVEHLKNQPGCIQEFIKMSRAGQTAKFSGAANDLRTYLAIIVTVWRSIEVLDESTIISIIERCFPDLGNLCLIEMAHSETAVEMITSALTDVFSTTRESCILSEVFFTYLELIARSFDILPSVFHLASLRSLCGIFGGLHTTEKAQIALTSCLERVLSKIVVELERPNSTLLTSNPDLVGMTLDTINAGLMTAVLTEGLLSSEGFAHALSYCIAHLCDCNHDRVLMTEVLLLQKFVTWLSPEDVVYHYQGQELCRKWRQKCQETSERCGEVAIKYNLVHAISKAVCHLSLTDFAANQQWLAIAGQCLHIVLNSRFSEVACHAIIQVLQELPQDHLPTVEEKETARKDLCNTDSSLRMYCFQLRKIVDMCKANKTRAEYNP